MREVSLMCWGMGQCWLLKGWGERQNCMQQWRRWRQAPPRTQWQKEFRHYNVPEKLILMTIPYLSQPRCKFMWIDQTIPCCLSPMSVSLAFLHAPPLPHWRSHLFSVIYTHANCLGTGNFQTIFDIRLWMASKAVGWSFEMVGEWRIKCRKGSTDYSLISLTYRWLCCWAACWLHIHSFMCQLVVVYKGPDVHSILQRTYSILRPSIV